MQACLINAKGQLGVENVPVPSISPGDVLIRLAASGICGTDIEKAHGSYGPGGILGHEVSGTIERIGAEVTGLRRGERVIAHHHVPCYTCRYCLLGDHTMCDFFKSTNFDPCGIAEFFRVPDENVSRGAIIPIPPEISFGEAAIIEPAACCVRALDRAHVKPGESALVVGLGPTGLTQTQLLRMAGAAPIIGADLLEHRLDAGLTFGASEVINTSSRDLSHEMERIVPNGADLVIVSTGNPKVIQQGIELVRKGGRLLLFGAPPLGSTIELNVGALFSRQISLITSYSCVESDIHQVIGFLSKGTIDLRSMITDWFTISEAPKAIEHARTSRTSVKTLIRP